MEERPVHNSIDGISTRDLTTIDGLVVRESLPLAKFSTFRIGGAARWLVEATTERSLRTLLELTHLRGSRPMTIGIGSNVLFPDEGFPGIVLRLGGLFRRLRFSERGVRAGGAVSLPQLAQKAARRGLRGLEPLSGFPSSVGGAVFMNAGCYGVEISELLVRATLVGLDGAKRVVTAPELQPSYRRTILATTGEIVTGATLRFSRGSAEEAVRRIQELNAKRWSSLPAGVANAGSTFRNPSGDYAGRLIEACGLKGAVRGGAEISAKHANVIVNRDGASADDVLGLMIDAHQEVRDRFGVELEPELVLVGSLRRRWLCAVGGPTASPVESS